MNHREDSRLSPVAVSGGLACVGEFPRSSGTYPIFTWNCDVENSGGTMVLVTTQSLTFVKVVRRQELLAVISLDAGDGIEHENKASNPN